MYHQHARMMSVMLDSLADGLSAEEIVAHYYSVFEEAVRASLLYASELAKERILPLGADVPPAAVASELDKPSVVRPVSGKRIMFSFYFCISNDGGKRCVEWQLIGSNDSGVWRTVVLIPSSRAWAAGLRIAWDNPRPTSP